MTAPDPALAAALDNLTTQVNPDNILAVHKVFRERADALEASLVQISLGDGVGLCGGDPISIDAAAAFNGKINQLIEVHRAHQRELGVAADHLRDIARRYGHTEEDIARSLTRSER